MNLVPRSIRPLASILAMLMGGALLSSCAGLAVGGNRDILVQDMYEVKKNLNEYIKNQAETDRKTTYQLGTLDENVQKNATITKSSIDELEQRIREQNEELTAIKAQLEQLKFAIDGMTRRPGGPGLTPTPEFTTPDANTPPGLDPVQPGLASGGIDQLLESSKRQFMLGNLDAARQGLESALALEPVGDQAVEVNFYLGECAIGSKDLPMAEKRYYDAIIAKPNHDKAWVSLERMADIKAEQGDNKKAVQMLEQIVSNKPAYQDIDRVRQKIANLQAGAPAAQ